MKVLIGIEWLCLPRARVHVTLRYMPPDAGQCTPCPCRTRVLSARRMPRLLRLARKRILQVAR